MDSPKFALRVGLLLYDRFRWLCGGYGVGVPMHELPLTVLESKDIRSPQSVWADLLASANLGLCPLYTYYVSKLSTHILRHDLGANELAIAT